MPYTFNTRLWENNSGGVWSSWTGAVEKMMGLVYHWQLKHHTHWSKLPRQWDHFRPGYQDSNVLRWTTCYIKIVYVICKLNRTLSCRIKSNIQEPSLRSYLLADQVTYFWFSPTMMMVKLWFIKKPPGFSQPKKGYHCQRSGKEKETWRSSCWWQHKAAVSGQLMARQHSTYG